MHEITKQNMQKTTRKIMQKITCKGKQKTYVTQYAENHIPKCAENYINGGGRRKIQRSTRRITHLQMTSSMVVEVTILLHKKIML